MKKGLNADCARDMLLALPVKLDTETVALVGSIGRVLKDSIRASVSVPPFDRSPYDGYAFRGRDTVNASRGHPAVLSVAEEIPAGKVPTLPLSPGQAAKILTGAPMPRGADATIKYEDTEYSDREVRIFAPVAPGSDVVLKGEDIPADTLIASAGTVITPPVMGLLAGQGYAETRVFRRPAIHILNTGSELMEAGYPLPPGKIYNSNVYTLSGYLERVGGAAVNGGIVADDTEEIAAHIDRAISHADMVITTGGASVGDYDCAVRAAQHIGAEVLFWKVALKPGGAMMAAVKDGKLILSLSGNPAAAVVGLLYVGLPYVKKLSGRKDVLPQAVEVRLRRDFDKKSPSRRILRGRLQLEDGIAWFEENAGRGNGSVSSFLDCDLLGEIPAGTVFLPAGTKIRAYRI